MTRIPVRRLRRVATLVIRPIDALREALQRPPFERGPVHPVRFGVTGRVVGGQLEPLPERRLRALAGPVRNLSGDTVFRDLGLPAGTYRIGLERDPLVRSDAWYEELDPAERDLVWDPAAPGAGLAGAPHHPSRLEIVRLRPAAGYPFPAGSTLVRGSLLWYDGTGLQGVVVRDPASLTGRNRPGPSGDFVLAYRFQAASGSTTLTLDRAGVDPAARPEGAAYLNGWPAQWTAPWARGETRSLRQGALAGVVLRPDGLSLEGATVRLAGRPGPVRTNENGYWRYHFPPGTPAGVVDLTVSHPDHPDATRTNVPFPADATASAPTITVQ